MQTNESETLPIVQLVQTKWLKSIKRVEDVVGYFTSIFVGSDETFLSSCFYKKLYRKAQFLDNFKMRRSIRQRETGRFCIGADIICA